MLEQYYRISQIAGIAIHINNDGTILIHVCTVIASGNELNIEKKIINIDSVEQLKQHLPDRSSIALNLSGKGVLHKKIDRVEFIDQSNFSKVLPNANIEDFYIQNFISGDSSFVSVIRKDEADKWIGQLQKIKLIPLMLSLGPFPIEQVISQLNIYSNEISINGHSITRNEKAEWINYRFDPAVTEAFPIKIASEKIDERLIIPYAAAFQLVLAVKLDPIQAKVGGIEAEFQRRLANNKIKVQGFLVLIVIFILLLTNFGLFSWLQSSNEALTGQVSRYNQNTTNLQDINGQISNKENKLKTLGWDGGINKSSLIDQIAALLPEEISWKEVALNPIDINNTRLQKTLTFYTNRILVTGTSEKIIPVNEWIARIKAKKWVKNIQLESYTYNNELNTGQFSITIDY